MRQFYLAMFCLLASGMFAQNIESNYPILSFTPDDLVFDYGEIIISNNDSEAYDLKLRQEIVDAPEGANMAICFGVTCFPPNAQDGYIYPAGFTLPGNGEDANFKVTYGNNGSDANAQWKLILFDENTNQDLYTFDVWYDGPLGLTEVYLSQSNLSLPTPNPVMGEASINYTLPVDVDEATISIHSITGSIVKEISVSQSEGVIRLYSSDFEKGVYFYSLNFEGSTFHTKRLVISQ